MNVSSDDATVDMGPLVALKDGKMWTLHDMILFYEEHGYMPVPIGGGSTDDPPEGDEGDEGDDDDDEGDEGDDPDDDLEDDGKGAGKKPVKLPKTQAELNVLMADRLARQKAKLTATIRKEVEREAQREAAKNDKNLARQLALANEELEELRPLKVAVDHFETSAEKRFRTALKTLPEHIKLMAPDDDASAVEKEKWLTNKAQPALDAFNKEQGKEGEGRKAKPGNSGRRPPNNGSGNGDSFDEMVEQARRTGLYRSMT